MLSFQANSTTLCDRITRREWLRVGGLGAFGLSAGSLRSASAAQPAATGELAASFGKAKRCIVLFMLGGPPQHETWDPKPQAPTEIRGDFGTIATATPGYHVGELMPQTAKLTEQIAVLRAMATDDNAHSSSGYWMLTGRPHSPKGQENALPGAPNNWPSLPAVVRHLKGDHTSLPGAIRLPEEIWNTGRIVWPGQDAGWLGDHADPWLVTCDPNKADFHVPDIGLPVEISPERFSRRNALRNFMNEHVPSIANTPVKRWASWQHKAVELLGSTGAQSAFALDQENAAIRDRYGRNRFGQSVLLARRLIEQGVSLVQVNWTRWKDDENVAPAWDTHAKNAERLKNALMPPMDQAYSALLEDLSERGMLEDTLVVWMGEFGRSPKINASGGRDHWGHCFSVALAGGGVRGGVVHGQSDRQGGYPLDGRVEPQDLSATVYHCLGIDPETTIRDPFGRPLTITTGQPIRAVL
ncbi:DUF1501 domain-containing protein [Bremerella cremea]|uniref:DUF1501 domain-containing protein n=1 Tax=Blastopirellula marina TaxID=124 RepID=A0A2S8G508_9BACT|nr:MULTISPECIES: DUF1501 domain-containing protein [Pirellulaceae]PQO39539.1 DUF1501 domain-containing protein [Blastopirellula marina]RCS51006.1 DUF1501 domain-containing protein [Bremerella cremea]